MTLNLMAMQHEGDVGKKKKEQQQGQEEEDESNKTAYILGGLSLVGVTGFALSEQKDPTVLAATACGLFGVAYVHKSWWVKIPSMLLGIIGIGGAGLWTLVQDVSMRGSRTDY